MKTFDPADLGDGLIDQPAEDNWNWYVQNAHTRGHLDFLQEASRQNAFYNGDQWDPKLKAELEKAGKPALTINLVMSVINTMAGTHALTREDVRFKPAKGEASVETANVLNKLYKSVAHENKLEFKEADLFMDGLIMDRGYYDVQVAFDDNLSGHIVVDPLDPREVILEAEASEYDPKSWNGVMRSHWVSPQSIKDTFGDKVYKRIEHTIANGGTYGVDSIRYGDERRATFGDEQDTVVNSYGQMLTSDALTREVRSMRLLIRQFYKPHPAKFFLNPITMDRTRIPGHWEEERIEKVRRASNTVVQEFNMRTPWITVSVDHHTLLDARHPQESFSIVPFFPYWRRGKPTGVVKHLISPQEQHNKLSSQMLAIVNSTANSGWIVEQDALVGMSPDDLEANGAKSGLIITKRRGREIEKIKPNAIPTGIDRVAEQAATNVQVISGVNRAALGQSPSSVSGVAIDRSTDRAEVQLQVPFRNLKRTRVIFAEKFLELTQSYMTEPRIFTYVRDDLPDSPSEQIQINQFDDATRSIVNDITLGKYSAYIGTGPSADSMSDAAFAEILQLRSAGVEIPGDRLVEVSNIPNKFEIAEEIRRLQGRGQLTPEEQEMQRMQQEIAMRGQYATVLKLEQEVKKTEAEIQKILADASQTANGAQSPEVQVKLEELRQKYAIAMKELEVRLELGGLGAVNKLDIANSAGNAKILAQAQMGQDKLNEVALSAKLNPKPKASDTKSS